MQTFVEENAVVETYPPWFRQKLMSMMTLPDPDDKGKRRESALSFSPDELLTLRKHKGWSFPFTRVVQV